MKIWAIIPVKSLKQTKSRLASILEPEERAKLTLKLLKRLLVILNNIEQVEKILVVSRDQRVSTLAQEAGQIALAEPEGADLNRSVAFAVEYALSDEVPQLLILPSDLPLVMQADIELFLNQAEDETAVICGDASLLGTNALLLPAGKPFVFRYGPNSFEQHLEEAKHAGLRTVSFAIPNIQFDLDTEEDWRQYLLQMK